MEPTTEFTDTADREWNLAISIGTARRLRDELKLDLNQVAEGKVFLVLSNDREKLGSALWILVERQAEPKNVTPEEFAQSLGGDALDGAMEALGEAIIRFSPRHQREALRKMLEKTMVAQDKTGTAAVGWIEAHADEITDREINKAMAKLQTTSGSRSPS